MEKQNPIVLELYSESGQQILRQEISSPYTQLKNLNKIPKGIYTLIIQKNGEIIDEIKIIKN
jgi:hypothetical protein